MMYTKKDHRWQVQRWRRPQTPQVTSETPWLASKTSYDSTPTVQQNLKTNQIDLFITIASDQRSSTTGCLGCTRHHDYPKGLHSSQQLNAKTPHLSRTHPQKSSTYPENLTTFTRNVHFTSIAHFARIAHFTIIAHLMKTAHFNVILPTFLLPSIKAYLLHSIRLYSCSKTEAHKLSTSLFLPQIRASLTL